MELNSGDIEVLQQVGIRHLQQLLVRFGYTRPRRVPVASFDLATQDASFDQATQVALGAYQAFYELSDDEVLQHLLHPRCGVPDRNALSDGTDDQGWPADDRDLAYAFEFWSGKQGIVPAPAIFEAVRWAFAEWAAKLGKRLSFREVRATEGYDIGVGWRRARHADDDLQGALLAHADFPPGAPLSRNRDPLVVHFDVEEHSWADGAYPRHYDIRSVALHEVGHTLGLTHSPRPEDVMFCQFFVDRERRALTDNDVDRLRRIYP